MLYYADHAEIMAETSDVCTPETPERALNPNDISLDINALLVEWADVYNVRCDIVAHRGLENSCIVPHWTPDLHKLKSSVARLLVG